MPRTVVYDSAPVQLALKKKAPPTRRGRPTGPSRSRRRTANEAPAEVAPAEAEQAAELPTKDELAAKVAKYVPGEVVAVSVPAFAIFEPTGNWVWGALSIGIFGNLLYLWVQALKLSVATRPRIYFYLLSAAAFIAWAIATIPQVRDWVGWGSADDADKATYVLFAAAFGLPLLDTALDQFEISIGK